MTWVSLQAWCGTMGVNYTAERSHTGLGDARLTARCVKEFLRRIDEEIKKFKKMKRDENEDEEQEKRRKRGEGDQNNLVS